MMPKRTSDVNQPGAASLPLRVVIITLDGHLSASVARARTALKKELPELQLTLHAATEWDNDPQALQRCYQAIEQGDIIITTMLFMEPHIQAVLPALQERRDHCAAMIQCLSAGEVMRLTRMGGFSMDGSQRGPLALLKRLSGRNKNKNQDSNNSASGSSSGAKQMAMLRRIPRILKFIPGTAQDVRAYFLTLQYWLAGSDENIANMVRFLVNRYADGTQHHFPKSWKNLAPLEYPEVGIYHPRMRNRLGENLKLLPKPPKSGSLDKPATVGLLVMRSYVLAGNTAHYDGVIEALEKRGLKVIPVFASGLDARPAVERFFFEKGKAIVDAVVSLTGFSLVGGPAYNDAKAAGEMLARLDVPYIAAHAGEFQTMDQWQSSERGLTPVETTMMVAIPELDGATGPIVFGGRTSSNTDERDMQVHPERAEQLAARVMRLIELRQTPLQQRKIAIVLFNFPPNSGATGSAAYLSVFASLLNTLQALQKQGYDTGALPADVDALRTQIINGNASRYGTDANVHSHIPVDDYVRRETWLNEIEAQWGAAPGRHLSDGSNLFVLGAQFGNIFVGIQPGFGYEGDPMRLLFEKSFTPTHAFSAFYRYLREDFAANAVLHFGTHGALEFMPGKQTGLSAECWPDRLIGDLPNFYLYAANNPSEGTIAKRRAAATLISYLTPPLARADLYRDLIDLKTSLERWRSLAPDAVDERQRLNTLITAQAAELDLIDPDHNEPPVVELNEKILELEYTLIPYGLHTVGEAITAEQRIDLLLAVAESSHGVTPERVVVTALVEGKTAEQAAALNDKANSNPNPTVLRELFELNRLLAQDHELPALLHALDGGFIAPAPGGDLLRNPDVLPSGRNLHGFDPFRIPSAFAVEDGAHQAELLLARHRADNRTTDFPESIALVLWGTDNLKTEGGPIAQALALIGAKPRFDSYGRLSGADLIELKELGRPRIDVVLTLSGIFRDLLPLQTRMLAEAAFLAASADEPAEQNFIRKHALAYQQQHDCDLETAALRVFSNADGSYGSNVNHLIDSSCWNDEDELAETYTRRKCYAYGRNGQPKQQAELLQSMLSGVQLTYQNLESVELGVTTVDHYFDTLGGISRAVRRARNEDIPVYIGDQTQGNGNAVVRTLSEQVTLETHTRMLNPKWYESMLQHGYEGVRHIEAHVTNTMGWSATTGQVAPWVYRKLTQTFVLDAEMRKRLAELNPAASAKVANRLLEAHERNYWSPDEEMLQALYQAGDELEDRLEGIDVEATA